MVKILRLIRILCEVFAAFLCYYAHVMIRAVRQLSPRYPGPEINFHSFPHKITFIFVLFVEEITVFISSYKYTLHSFDKVKSL